MRDANLKAYIGALIAFPISCAALWIYWHGFAWEPRFAIAAAVLAAFVFLGDLYSIQISERSSIGAWDIALIVAVASLGPVWAALAALPSAIFVGWRNPLRIAYEIGHSATIVFAAGVAFSFASEPVFIGSISSFPTILYATLVAGTVLVGASEAINGILFKVKYGQSFNETWRQIVQPYLVSDAVNVLTAGMSVLALIAYGPLAAIVVVAGSVGSQALVYRSREQVKEIAGLRARVESLEEALTSSNTTFGLMMIEDLGRKDGYTHHHAAATAVYAADIAREMRMDDARVRWLRMAGLLHNVGMFSLPDDLLLSTGRLNSIGRREIHEHPERGERILATVPEFEEMASWVRWHHERPDGRGYPDRLKGPWIPVEAKVLAVAQAYAAMVLDGPRRAAREPEEARRELVSGMEAAFDGVVVRAFLRVLDTGGEGYRRADDHRFVFPSPSRRHEAPAPRLVGGEDAAGPSL